MSMQLSLFCLIAGTAMAVSGCGGGGTQAAAPVQSGSTSASSGTEVQATPTTPTASTTPITAGTASVAAVAVAANDSDDVPRVEDVVLVSSTRVDRTRFDYKFKLLVKGAYETYEAGSFSVSKLPKGSQATVGTVTFGQIDALRLTPSGDTITLRHDRTYPFVKTDLKFDFSGKLASTNAPADAPKIGPLKYYMPGGRPGHEGYFENVASNPIAGTGTQLRVALPGNISSASYTFKSALGATLSTGVLNKLWAGNGDASAMVDIPAEPFTVSILATGTNGSSASSTSGLVEPQTFVLDLIVENGAFRFGEVIRGHLDVGKASKADQLVIEVSLPDGFTAPQTHFEIPVGSTTNMSVPLLIQSPAAGKRIAFHKISILYYLKSAPAAVTTSVASVFSR